MVVKYSNVGAVFNQQFQYDPQVEMIAESTMVYALVHVETSEGSM